MDKLRGMEVFREVARKHSFSKAAESLDLANSAVSRYVTELERWLNVKLLYRTTRSLTLTEEGKLYLEKIDDILTSVATLENISVASQQELRGTLRITAPNFWGTFVLKPLMVEFMGKHPNVNINSLFLYRKVNLIEEGYDLAVRIGHLPSSGLIARQVSTMQLKLVATPVYIEKNGLPTHPRDLVQHQCLIDTVPDYHSKWPFIENKKNFSVAVDGKMLSNEPELLRDLALDSQGITYLPEFFVDPYIKSGEFIELLPEYCISNLPVNIVYPQNKQMNPALRVFINTIVENLKSSCTKLGESNTRKI
ncbi:LysR family transcriptional regulator [Vibrio sp. SNU_ST1]|uniref:LysR family transcriptional regulator n=1 Tax=Vibrio sp. SNU_ST1 TaxID=3064001 RepID=UPI00272CCCA2|nr:LysR family transcriptional regulator [Vibrio sp. SNU_ST1]WKY57273.1 LysR family transcriptional regulator [Vibrio sp. SNU_ST1]